MADHALVAGCDAYPHVPGGDLRGAVADALAMHEWLTGAAGVPPENATLLLSGSPIGKPVPGDGVSGPADRSRFAREVTRLIAETGVEASRLYVYFAGHGCRSDPLNPALATDVLAFTGFEGGDPSPATVGVGELVRKLRLSRFREVVVILDACRDFPFAEAFQVGGIGRDPLASPPRTPRLYLLQATQPGWYARGDETAGGVRGRLTGAVLDGLAGRETAKRYVEMEPMPYTVSWQSLVAYVIGAMGDQEPHDEGAARALVLARFPEDHFEPVRLTVEVFPPAIGADADLRVVVGHWSLAGPDYARMLGFGPAPVHFTVPPRRHTVIATLGDKWGRAAVDVYADQQVTVSVGVRRPRSEPETAGPIGSRGGREDTGLVRVTTADPAAVVEIRSLIGRPIGASLNWTGERRREGRYLAVATGADGRERSETFEIVAGQETRLRFALPRPRGAEDRDGLSPWAGPAAALAHRLLGEARPGEFVCLVGDGPGLSAVRAHRADGRAEVLPPRQRLVAPPGTRLLELVFGSHRLDVTAVAGHVAAVVFAGAELRVSYFDSALVRDETTLLRLDRAQRLLAAGRDEAARLVLRWLGRAESEVAARLLEALPGVTERYRVRGCAYPVYLDRPVTDPR